MTSAGKQLDREPTSLCIQTQNTIPTIASTRSTSVEVGFHQMNRGPTALPTDLSNSTVLTCTARWNTVYNTCKHVQASAQKRNTRKQPGNWGSCCTQLPQLPMDANMHAWMMLLGLPGHDDTLHHQAACQESSANGNAPSACSAAARQPLYHSTPHENPLSTSHTTHATARTRNCMP